MAPNRASSRRLQASFVRLRFPRPSAPRRRLKASVSRHGSLSTTMSEGELVALLDTHDSLVMRCVSGQLSLAEFLQDYGNFPNRYALDGHEASAKELEML